MMEVDEFTSDVDVLLLWDIKEGFFVTSSKLRVGMFGVC